MTPIEGIEYCTAHDDVWLEGEEECQSVYFDHSGNDGTACVGHPLWWGDQRADREAIIDAALHCWTGIHVAPLTAEGYDSIIAIVEHDGEERPNMADCPT